MSYYLLCYEHITLVKHYIYRRVYFYITLTLKNHYSKKIIFSIQDNKMCTVSFDLTGP